MAGKAETAETKAKAQGQRVRKLLQVSSWSTNGELVNKCDMPRTIMMFEYPAREGISRQFLCDRNSDQKSEHRR